MAPFRIHRLVHRVPAVSVPDPVVAVYLDDLDGPLLRVIFPIDPEFEKVLTAVVVDARPRCLDRAPPDVTQFFRAWISKGSFPWEQDGWPFWSVLHHASTFWAYRDLPNIHLAHYGDLKRDLDGEMRRIARILDIEVEEALWPTLVEAAGFDSMKERADMLAPEVDLQAWSENKRFFNKGTSGQWRDVLTERELALYGRAVEERLDPALAKWLENGGSSSG